MNEQQIQDALQSARNAMGMHGPCRQNNCSECTRTYKKIVAAMPLAEASADEEADLIAMAKEANPEYPYDPNHKLPLREAVWALCTALEGTELACEDLHKVIKARDEQIASLQEELAKANRARKWNIEETATGLRICKAEHERHEGCEWIEYVPVQAKQPIHPQDAEQFVGMWLDGARIEWLARNPDNEVVSYAKGSQVLLTAVVNWHRLRLEYDYENGERQVTKAEIG